MVFSTTPPSLWIQVGVSFCKPRTNHSSDAIHDTFHSFTQVE